MIKWYLVTIFNTIHNFPYTQLTIEANIKAELTGRTPHLAASCTLLEQLQCGQPFTSPPEKGIPSMISREEIPRHFCLFPQWAGISAMIQFLLQSSVQFWSVKTFPWKPVPLKLPFIKLFPHRVFQMNQLLLSTELPVTRVSSLCSKYQVFILFLKPVLLNTESSISFFTWSQIPHAT